jgi:DNA-directed RNA polymerase
MTKKDNLIYQLIFEEKKSFLIDISEYIDDIYEYEDFVSDIKKILKKSKVKIEKSIVNIDSKTAKWGLMTVSRTTANTPWFSD